MICYSSAFYGQTAFINGTITDENNKPVDLANISVIGEKKGTVSDIKGKFRLEVPSGKEIVIGISYIGYADKKYPMTLEQGEERDISFELIPISTDLPGFTFPNPLITSTLFFFKRY